MLSQITCEGDYIRAVLFDRQSAAETRSFLESVIAAATMHDCSHVLISVRASRPLFKVDDYGISDYFSVLRDNPAYRVALLSDSEETYASHRYIEALARLFRARVKSFRSEAAALEWLRDE